MRMCISRGWREERSRTTTRSRTFNQVVMLLAEEGAVSLKEVILDGTKIDANANRYRFVWGKAIKVSRERIERQLRELWAYVERVYQDEEQQPNEPEFEAIDPVSVARTIAEINEALKEKEIDPKVRQKLKYAEKNWPQKLAEYDEKDKILRGRHSYSKTDEDATFMRMKEDHMRNGQLKPGYNVQASTEKQYIINYTLGQTTSDTSLLKDHIGEHIESYGRSPESLTAERDTGAKRTTCSLKSKASQRSSNTTTSTGNRKRKSRTRFTSTICITTRGEIR